MKADDIGDDGGKAVPLGADGLARPGDGDPVGDRSLAVEYRPAAGLIPYARNARTHSDVQVAQIAASIKEFGWTNPILVDPWREAWALFLGDVAYVWHGALHAGAVAESLEAAGFATRSQIIWDKTRLVIGRGDYQWQHEPCWYTVRRGRKGHWSGDRRQTTVWAIPHRKSASGHGTQKPVECMKRPIENNSSPGQAIYEPFCGSGTTIIAAEMTGRFCHAVELNPAYVDLAVTRWQDFTGEKATLEGDGRSFAEVKAVRLGALPDSGTVMPGKASGVPA